MKNASVFIDKIKVNMFPAPINPLLNLEIHQPVCLPSMNLSFLHRNPAKA